MQALTVLATVFTAAALLATDALAQAKVVHLGLIQDFTRVYTFVTEEYNQGEQDYLELVNLSGGVGGYTFEALVTDTGNEPQRGIEAYERFKREGALVFDFLSTPVSRANVPRILKDGNVLITVLHGRSDATDGTTFPTIFPIMATYWSQATVVTKYVLDQEGGSLQGKKVALVHIDSPFGREPIPVFETLAGRLGFQFQDFPYPSPGTEQSATWTQVRRFRPDWVVLWGAGGGQPVAVREAIRNGIRTDRIVSVVWLAEKDMQVVGAQQARGVLRFEAAAAGTEPVLVRDILEKVYGAGRGHGDRANVGSTYYNIGVGAMATVVEGIRIALQRWGEPLTAEKIKTGLESLQGFDAEGLMPPIAITSEDHEGGGVGRISQWDGSRWVPRTDWYGAYRDIVWNLVRESAAQFRATGE
ncbi:ABC transporter substrate-binding protein [Limnochorda pilosa]|uniref:ABC transporter substrate-binding protein n=1 Tax=Limnochorda pilosa TaxID=1555112 RepID=A0A0K2SJD5_LIMPI|nr:ABC transporter substrate-binding protein [Limnochorda pilosa]